MGGAPRSKAVTVLGKRRVPHASTKKVDTRAPTQRGRRAYQAPLSGLPQRCETARDEVSIDAAAAAISRFEGYTRHRDFKTFHFEQARGFKTHLMSSKNARTDRPLSASTVRSTLAALKAFFIWLADQPGYASRIKYADAEYFSAPDSVSRVATGRIDSSPVRPWRRSRNARRDASGKRARKA
jgi:hypothetical protein